MLAKFLGPFNYGIWGFINLALRYLSYTSFGLQYALNVELSTQKGTNKNKISKIIGNSIVMTFLISVFIIFVGYLIRLKKIELFPVYSFNRFIIFAVIITFLTHLVNIFKNIYRSYGYLFRIAFGETLLSVSTLLCVFFFSPGRLINALLYAWIISETISILVYVVKFPFPIKISIDSNLSRKLLASGISLLIYNMSFYLIMVVSTTIISTFYSVEEMGYYTLANRITTTSLLGLSAITWVLYPKFLWSLRKERDLSDTQKTVNQITTIYSNFVYLIIFTVIMFSPILFIYLEKYKPLAPALNYLLISQAIFSSCIGYNSLAVARKKEQSVAKIGLITVVFVGLLGIITAKLKLNFSIVALTVTFGMIIYTVLQTKLGESLMKQEISTWESFKRIFPPYFLVPSVIIIIGNLFGYCLISGAIGFTIFIIYNLKRIIFTFNEAKILLLRSDFKK